MGGCCWLTWISPGQAGNWNCLRGDEQELHLIPVRNKTVELGDLVCKSRVRRTSTQAVEVLVVSPHSTVIPALILGLISQPGKNILSTLCQFRHDWVVPGTSRDSLSCSSPKSFYGVLTTRGSSLPQTLPFRTHLVSDTRGPLHSWAALPDITTFFCSPYPHWKVNPI